MMSVGVVTKEKTMPKSLRKNGPVSEWKNVLVLCFALLLAHISISGAYTVEISTSTALEEQFLTATAQQFDIVVTSNPFFGNTYTMQLLGINPAYNPAPTNAQLLQDIVTVDSYTYVYGWADGESYMQSEEVGIVGSYANLCGSATNFMLNQSSTATFDQGTCEDTLATVIDQIYQLQLSSPTVVPGDFQ